MNTYMTSTQEPFNPLHSTKEFIISKTKSIQKWSEPHKINELKSHLNIKDFNKLFEFKSKWDALYGYIPLSYLPHL